MEEPGPDAPRELGDGGTAGGAPGPQHVNVRRKAALFGDTPIEIPSAPPTDEVVDEEQEDASALEPRVRNAAIAAAVKNGLLACFAGVMAGIALFCFLSNLLPGGGSLMIGLVVAGIAVPVAVLAALGAYRQTLETERHKVGLCPRCGYDLRGSVGVRCPECGWRIRTPGRSQAPWTEEDEAREHID